mgnify:CR=1 FL=1
MAVLTFVLAMLGVSALIYAGHRFNMYLFAQGAVAASSRDIEEALPVREVREVMEIEDYGMRSVRVGLLICTGFVVLMLLVLVAALFAVLR